MTRNYLDILAETIRNNWDQPALTDFYLTEDGSAQDTSRGNHYTYGEMYEEICRVADLLTRCGLKKGDHIAICGVNSAHWVIAYLAIAKMQGVSVTIMHSLQPDEIASQVEFADCKALFVERNHWQELKPICKPAALVHMVALEDFLILQGRLIRPLYINTQNEEIVENEISFLESAPNDLAMICFTSGSTDGIPKGVMLSYGNISAGIKGTAEACVLGKNKSAFAFLPIAHIFSFGGQLITPLVYGGHILLFRDGLRFELLRRAISLIKPYAIHTVPIIATKLLKCDLLSGDVLNNLDYLVVGGAKLSDSDELAFIEKHIPLAPGYGLTETAGSISMTPLPGYKIFSVGRVSDTIEARISQQGEILIKGETVMLGYYKDPEATAQKIDKDGWLHTGDKGHLDEDGYLYVEGRLEQDIIVLPNGENIRPDNIESLINALPEVKESIVLARDGHLVAIVVPTTPLSSGEGKGVRLSILRIINPQLPLFSQLYDVEISDTPLQRTVKQTIKRYLYK